MPSSPWMNLLKQQQSRTLYQKLMSATRCWKLTRSKYLMISVGHSPKISFLDSHNMRQNCLVGTFILCLRLRIGILLY